MTYTFLLTADHIALLRAAWVVWDDCEFGAPTIDCKRPYGKGAVVDSILEILGWEPEGIDAYGDRAPSPEQRKRAEALHGETRTALQIILTTGTFVPGTYEMAREYEWTSWQMIDTEDPS